MIFAHFSPSTGGDSNICPNTTVTVNGLEISECQNDTPTVSVHTNFIGALLGALFGAAVILIVVVSIVTTVFTRKWKGTCTLK